MMQICHSTEDARTKYCPFSFSSVAGGSMCIANDCMAWRWVRTHINNPDEPTGDLVPSDNTHGVCNFGWQND